MTFSHFCNAIQKPGFFFTWLGLIIISYFFIDQPLAQFFWAQQGSMVVSIANILTDLGKSGFYILFFLLSFIVFRFIRKRPKLADQSLFFFLVLIIPGIVITMMKFLLGRARPVEFFHNDIFGFHFFQTAASMKSFPSGHTTTITALMIALCFLLPRYWIAFVLTFIVISFTRVIVNAHYLSDILAGMYIATLLTLWIHHWLFKSGNKFLAPQKNSTISCK